MRDEPFDILTLNETRLDNSILDCEVQIPGYDIIRSDRNRNGGGVAITDLNYWIKLLSCIIEANGGHIGLSHINLHWYY